MFEVQSYKLVNSLVERTKGLQKKLTAGILQDHQDINKKSVVPLIIIKKSNQKTNLKECYSSHRLCNEFENILAKMIIPFGMQELMALKVKTKLVASVSPMSNIISHFWFPLPHLGLR